MSYRKWNDGVWLPFAIWGLCGIMSLICGQAQGQAANDDQRVRAVIAEYAECCAARDAARMRLLLMDPDTRNNQELVNSLQQAKTDGLKIHMDFSNCTAKVDVYQTAAVSNLWTAAGLMREDYPDDFGVMQMVETFMVFILRERDGVMKIDSWRRMSEELYMANMMEGTSIQLNYSDVPAFRLKVTQFGEALSGGKRDAVERELAAVDLPTREWMLKSLDLPIPVAPQFGTDTQPLRIIMCASSANKIMVWVRVYPGLTSESRATGDLLGLEYRPVNGVLTLVGVPGTMGRLCEAMVKRRQAELAKERKAATRL